MNPTPSDDFRDGLMAAVPSLRAFARSLSGSMDRADDLVQETLVKAWSNASSFQPGTNLNAWLFTILRNVFYSEMRKRRREVEDVDGSYAQRLAIAGEQSSHVDFADFQAALAKLPSDHREVLILIGASGFSYEEAAEICGVAVGTIKSRLNRARNRLAQMMAIDEVGDIGPDPMSQAALSITAKAYSTA